MEEITLSCERSGAFASDRRGEPELGGARIASDRDIASDEQFAADDDMFGKIVALLGEPGVDFTC